MTNARIWQVLNVLKGLYLLNYPEATFAPNKKIRKAVLRQDLLDDLQGLAWMLQVEPGRDFHHFLESVRTHVELAVELFYFFKTTQMVVHSGPPARGNFFLLLKGSLPERILLIPALVPLENAEYKLRLAEDFPADAWESVDRDEGQSPAKAS